VSHGSAAFVLNAYSKLMLRVYQWAYQSECGDKRVQERHWVSVH